MKPLAIDLYCGLGGWAEGFLSEGYDVIGFDIEARPYPGQLVLQDVLTIHGRQFKDAAVIVGSSPCQEFSYRAMPWKRAKALPPPHLGMKLFKAQLRIRWEASEAAGRAIPLVIENVKGAQPWVGRAKAHFGSFYLWGDVESVGGAIVAGGVRFGNTLRAAKRSMKMGRAPIAPNGVTRRFTNPGEWQDGDTHEYGSKNDGGSWFNIAHNTKSGVGNNPDGRKVAGDWFGSYSDMKAAGTISPGRLHGKGSKKRAAASAQIAKIPFELARHIAAVYKPLSANSRTELSKQQ